MRKWCYQEQGLHFCLCTLQMLFLSRGYLWSIILFDNSVSIDIYTDNHGYKEINLVQLGVKSTLEWQLFTWEIVSQLEPSESVKMSFHLINFWSLFFLHCILRYVVTQSLENYILVIYNCKIGFLKCSSFIMNFNVF